ncbi:MAG: hypothetical protein ACLFT6_06915 [Bacteroidales bacterium]
MLYLIERRVQNTFIQKNKSKFIRIEETLKFDFSENKYRLVDMEFEELEQLEGGEDDE